MIYDIKKHSVESLMKDECLISQVMKIRSALSRSEAIDQIKSAYNVCSLFVKPEPVVSNDHQPCVECGSISFIRTGTCFVCQVCGSSQGCS